MIVLTLGAGQLSAHKLEVRRHPVISYCGSFAVKLLAHSK